MRSVISTSHYGAGLVCLATAAAVLGCSSSSNDGYNVLPGQGTTTGAPVAAVTGGGDASGAASTDASSGSTNTTGGGPIVIDPNVNQGNTGGEEMNCAASDVPTSLQQVVLAFVFDVSASMGNEQEAYFNRELKWDPVVAATKAFFSDPYSAGLAATLTFFPNELAAIAPGPNGMTGMGGGFFPGGGGGECDAAGYATPDVPLTALPSPAFAAAIDAVTPPDTSSWRLGTPTLAALQGTITAIDTMRAADPNSAYTIVLVTDGMPALCGGAADTVQAVADAAAAVAGTIPTYVIGVNNPVTAGEPNPPDTVTDLNVVAQAGGTQNAFIIDTNNPAETSAQLKTVIETIRESTFSCSIAIPAPPMGETFDPNKVNVASTSTATGDVPFIYDPTCAQPNSWHYDNEAAPTTIEICQTACDGLRTQLDGQLSIQLGCRTRIK
jgi:hypothetical protein